MTDYSCESVFIPYRRTKALLFFKECMFRGLLPICERILTKYAVHPVPIGYIIGSKTGDHVPNIFEYTDYRAFLQDYYTEKKAEDPKYSHRWFAMKAGVRSSGYFSDVLSGKRHLTPAAALKFAKAMKLDSAGTEHFEAMVGYARAKTIDERAHFYEKVLARQDVQVSELERDKFEFYGKWQYSAVRELLYFFPFDGDYEALGKKLQPSISAHEARKAVELLKRLGLVKKNAAGNYVQSTPLLSTGADNRSLHVARFQRATIALAAEALDRFSGEVRDSSTLTMTLSEESFRIARKEVRQLRRRLLALAEKDESVDRVYQFNFQLFPLSRW